MAKVTGIGGVFLRAQDPTALARRYATHPGMATGHAGWAQVGSPTCLAPILADSDHFPAPRPDIRNLRVDDLPARIGNLNAAGIATETRPEWDGPSGLFARIVHPGATRSNFGNRPPHEG